MNSLRKLAHIHIVDSKDLQINESASLAIIGSCDAATIKSESWVATETIVICRTAKEAFDEFAANQSQIFICDMYPDDSDGWTGVRAAEKVRLLCRENGFAQPAIYLLTKEEPTAVEITWAKKRACVNDVIKRAASSLHKALASNGHPQQSQFITKKKLLNELELVDEIFKGSGVGPVAKSIIEKARIILNSETQNESIDVYIDYLASKIISEAKRNNFLINCTRTIAQKKRPLN